MPSEGYSYYNNEGKKITYKCRIPSPQYLSGDVVSDSPLTYTQVNENFHTLEGMDVSGMYYDGNVLYIQRADGKVISAKVSSSGEYVEISATTGSVSVNGLDAAKIVVPIGSTGISIVTEGALSGNTDGFGRIVLQSPDQPKTADVNVNGISFGKAMNEDGLPVSIPIIGSGSVSVTTSSNGIIIKGRPSSGDVIVKPEWERI